mgnify:CR=1 FL=1
MRASKWKLYQIGGNMKGLHFIDEHGTFTMEQAENESYLYFPVFPQL